MTSSTVAEPCTPREDPDSVILPEDARVTIYRLFREDVMSFVLSPDASIGQLLNRMKPFLSPQEYDEYKTLGCIVLLGTEGPLRWWKLCDEYVKFMESENVQTLLENRLPIAFNLLLRAVYTPID